MVPTTIPGIGLSLASAPIRICLVMTRYRKMGPWTFWNASVRPICARWNDSLKISTNMKPRVVWRVILRAGIAECTPWHADLIGLSSRETRSLCSRLSWASLSL